MLGKEARGEKRAWPKRRARSTSSTRGSERGSVELDAGRFRAHRGSSSAARRAFRAQARCWAAAPGSSELRRDGATAPSRRTGGIVIPAAVRIFVSVEPADMRQGFDRLAQRVKASLGEDPSRASAGQRENQCAATRHRLLRTDAARSALATAASSAGFYGLEQCAHAARYRLAQMGAGREGVDAVLRRRSPYRCRPRREQARVDRRTRAAEREPSDRG